MDYLSSSSKSNQTVDESVKPDGEASPSNAELCQTVGAVSIANKFFSTFRAEICYGS